MRGELLLLVLLTGELVLCSSQNCTHYKGIKGEDIILPPKVNCNLSEIIWKKEVNKKFNKVAEWDGKLHLYPQLSNRAEIEPSSGNLTIRNISQEIDGGKYMAESFDGNSECVPGSPVCLEVLEPPAAPNLTCTIGDDGIYVNCMLVIQYELFVSFHWEYIDMKDIREGINTEKHSSVKLPSNTDQSRNITCIIEASRSRVNNSISLLTCDSRGASSQERTRSITVFLIVGIIIVLIVAFFLWRKKVCRRPDKLFCKEDPENEIREENPPNDGRMSSHGQMSEPENKKTPCSEEDPERHDDEIELTHPVMSDTENKKTSSSEDLFNKPPDESTPLCEENSEATKISNTEDLFNKPPDECTPLCEANFEATETSNTEITSPES